MGCTSPFSDVYVRSGVYKAEAFPKVLGGDFSGTVCAVPADGASSFAVGDVVFGLSSTYLSQADMQGTYAEYAVVKQEWCARVPAAGLTAVTAAAVPLVALTAWQALERAAPKPGQRILINGASGGVGIFAVQLAKKVHALHITALCSAANAEWVRALGADAVIDYALDEAALEAAALGGSGDEAAAAANKFDILLDVVGGRLLEFSHQRLMKAGGCVSHVFNRGSDHAGYNAHLQATGVNFQATLVQPNGAQMAQIAAMFAAGDLTVRVAATMPLEQAGAAQDLVMTGHAAGKVVLTL
jgi:NADPH:quinone reductase-like Zn-dependent oxidoreductase